jgi:AcrR family transcriptional regulator
MSDIDAPDPSPVDRGARRRARTHARLLEAARVLFARQGVEATRINEITEQADVGFGSFYNHFDSKEAIVEAVLQETIAAQGAAVDAVTRDLDDPAEVMAVAHRYFVDLAGSDPTWGWLLVRLEVSHDIALRALRPYASRDLKRGIDNGRFRIPDSELALVQLGGALLAVMRFVLDGHATPNAGQNHAEGILRTLGVDPADAAEIAHRPMPPVPAA